MTETVEIVGRDYWAKTLEIVHMNWAILSADGRGAASIHFLNGLGGVFDELATPSADVAEAALRRNGFERYSESEALRQRATPPSPPFHRARHANGRIYSEGGCWRS